MARWLMQEGPMIRTELVSTSSRGTIHELLVDIGVWAEWSPHVAGRRAEQPRVIETLAAPLSARGQRRRMARLSALAERIELGDRALVETS